ncbi:MAG: OmpA/MotB family protein [Nitrospinota bacterium]
MEKEILNDSEEEEDEVEKDLWMITFYDLLSLLLTFFVLLYSMKTLDDNVLKEMFLAFDSSISIFNDSKLFSVLVKDKGLSILPKSQHKIQDLARFLKSDLAKAKEILSIDIKDLEDSLYLTEAMISKVDDSYRISYIEGKMFEIGSASLTEDAKEALVKLAKVIKYSDRSILVEGHTDSVPISTSAYKFNLELSAARAQAVLRYLVLEGEIKTDRFIGAIGYGSSRPKVSNITERFRTLNRRVEIIFKQKRDI